MFCRMGELGEIIECVRLKVVLCTGFMLTPKENSKEVNGSVQIAKRNKSIIML